MSESIPAPQCSTRLGTAVAILLLRDRPCWGQTRSRRVLRLFVFAFYGLAMLTLLLKLFENRLAFPGATYSAWEEPPEADRVEQLALAATDGNTISAWFTAPAKWKPADGVLLYSHGNGANLTHWQPTTWQYRGNLGMATLIYDYPGFGKSTGQPTEQGCYAATDAAYTWLVQAKQIPGREVILVGSSLGGAFAVDLASRAECRMLILVNAFTSFPDMAQNRFQFLPARWLVSNRMDSAGKISFVKAPVFITHNRADGVVPFWMGERLYERANEPKRFYPVADGGHRDPDEAGYFAAIKTFLAETK